MVVMVDDAPVTLAQVAELPANETPAVESLHFGPDPVIVAPVLPPVRYSRLRLMAQSPAHYLEGTVEQTRCMEQGSAVDHLVFCTKTVLAYPGKVRSGKEWKSFKLDHPEREFCVVTGSEYAEARAIAAAVKADKRAMRILRGEHQKEIFWKFCGRDCVSHLDNLGKDGAWVAELKVSQTSNPFRFRWHALKMMYHAQLGFYEMAAEFENKKAPRAHFIVCVESTAPHVVTVFKLTHKAVELGKRSCRAWMERLLQCEAANFWPGYSQSIVPLDGPEDEILESEGITF